MTHDHDWVIKFSAGRLVWGFLRHDLSKSILDTPLGRRPGTFCIPLFLTNISLLLHLCVIREFWGGYLWKTPLSIPFPPRGYSESLEGWGGGTSSGGFQVADLMLELVSLCTCLRPRSRILEESSIQIYTDAGLSRGLFLVYRWDPPHKIAMIFLQHTSSAYAKV